MPVRSTPLVIERLVQGTDMLPAYICGSGVTAIIKEVVVDSLSNANVTAYVGVGRGSDSTIIVQEAFTVAGTRRHEFFTVLQPGDVINLIVGSAIPLTASIGFWISGAELAGVAP